MRDAFGFFTGMALIGIAVPLVGGCGEGANGTEMVVGEASAITGHKAAFREEATPHGGVSFWNLSTVVTAMAKSGNVLFVGGSFRIDTGGASYYNLAAFALPDNPDSIPVLVSSFMPNPSGAVFSLVADGNRLYVGGGFTTIGGQSKTGLAAVDAATGQADAGFTANVGGSAPNVNSLALIGTNSLLLGGTFSSINGTSRQSMAAISRGTGALRSTFAGGVNGTLSSVAFVDSWGLALVAGSFTSVQGVGRANLAALDEGGVVQSTQFKLSGNVNISVPIFSMDADAGNPGQVFVGTMLDDTLSNRVISFWATGTNAGKERWRSARFSGDLQAVDCYDGAVYFGVHDGMFANGDHRLLGALDASDGSFLEDMDLTPGTCSSSVPGNCFAPVGSLPFLYSDATWGTRVIRHYKASGNPPRLLVGGGNGNWGGVSQTDFFASFSGRPY